jgi:hypothetical protein
MVGRRAAYLSDGLAPPPHYAISPHAGTFVAIMILALAVIGTVQAINIPIDLGKSGFSLDTSIPFSDLNGTSLADQTLSVDFTFANPGFVRLFTVTTDFGAAVRLETNGSNVGFLKGKGYLIDAQGNALHTAETLGSASSSSTLFATLFPPAGLQRPVDFFGVHYDFHYDFMFPEDPSVDVTGGQLRLFIPGLDAPFGIGPGVPADIVPDVGDTIFLLGIGLVGLGVLRRQMATT